MDEPGLRFAILGPLRVSRRGTPVRLGPVQQRVVLAVLLLRANRPVARQSLIDAVWGEEPPAYAVNLVQRHASGLRRALGVRLTWTDAGYTLTVPPGCLDLAEFEAALGRARAARDGDDPATAAGAFRAAAALWRGPVCAGLSSPWLDAERDRLAEVRLDADEDRLDAEISAGEHAGSILELRRLAARHPLRERLTTLLMLALSRSGRQADALAVFTAARTRLRDELGVDPGEPMRLMHRRILTGAGAGDTTPAGAGPVAAQLPRPVREFVGRSGELGCLDSLLDDDRGCLAAISGTAGVGKTTLAVTWAHRVRHRFPDGQLYVNLHGFDPTGRATEPAKAIRGFLDALAVPPDRIPTDPEALSALYRSLLADRRMLVLLDNARDAAQVRPLLPGSPGCLVVVTSRDRLLGLVAGDGAYPVPLDLLPESTARQLLGRRLGDGSLRAEPSAIDEIIAGCAGLPLALTVVAARAAMSPALPLSAVAGELREARGNLDVFDGGDPATDVRAVFACSYEALSSGAACLFRLLSVHAGPDVSSRAAASLAAESPAAARAGLAELTRANLVTERAPGRFTMHDLLRAYARELTGRLDSPRFRQDALVRVLDHYLHSADRAGTLLLPHRDDPVTLPPPSPGVRPEQPDGHEAAGRWFTVEEPVLLAAVRQASREGHDRHTWQLAWALAHPLFRRGHWQDAAAIGQAALDAARRLGDPRGLAVSHGGVAYACIRLERYHDAYLHLHEVFELYRGLDDPIGMAHAHRSTAWALDRQDRFREALTHVHRALHLFRQAGHSTGEARCLNAIGWFHYRLADPEKALDHCRRALDLQEKIGDRFDMGDTLDSLGRILHRLGRLGEAADCFRQAIDLYRELGDSYNTADTSVSLGDSRHAAGDLDGAREKWRTALAIFERLGHPDADGVRARMRESNHPID
ncbi:AfsR/SARP family transcriptional regulator [Actinoplanes couchii]|uniref:SARP family transcriptional regulator n=1 Tax=Actinoplanes couchii TaxID=403638 RepID=A0ABQ3XLK1_9ACTN|nr:BTAD domain-containing putative transcriptional regulator [Actinoplanes couchii]MDR6319390.1 DNA-binding SARP family transcriptional activator/tetratricopeptide (TPR) repeat protein [Actinoplanes couchii]GID59399.1 SARP family transcriptional regulator [Actinoplanes couchii]